MAVLNESTNEVTFKIVYCGTPLGGKTTNLQWVHQQIDKSERGDLISLATSADRTLFFDFLPVNSITAKGFRTKFQLYTVPGQVQYNATRQLVLRGVDGIVFVADSQIERMEENVWAMKTLQQNLADNGVWAGRIPIVLQFNKRDLPNSAPLEHLDYVLNDGSLGNGSDVRLMRFEAAASQGYNVFETLNAVAIEIINRFNPPAGAGRYVPGNGVSLAG
ncbi:MAG: GTPase domain-containing protein [Verrucomicrobia bacterium]|nr:GTPase domain-containing protein [Verrucomicrobiota bacterium]